MLASGRQLSEREFAMSPTQGENIQVCLRETRGQHETTRQLSDVVARTTFHDYDCSATLGGKNLVDVLAEVSPWLADLKPSLAEVGSSSDHIWPKCVGSGRSWRKLAEFGPTLVGATKFDRHRPKFAETCPNLDQHWQTLAKTGGHVRSKFVGSGPNVADIGRIRAKLN